ncbi:MAG: hypothetical protein NTV51_30320, partial [Verrucomicrobia bacterium]|nr:hypothetical protein [Verrucomicrobiota bacterium]
MKTLSAAFGAALVLAVSLAARAETSAQAWLETYYLNPEPERLPLAVQELSRNGYFDRAGHLPLAIGFLSTVFAQNPQRVDTWLLSLSDLPLRHQRLLACSLWQAGHALGSEMMTVLSEHSAIREEVRRLAS